MVNYLDGYSGSDMNGLIRDAAFEAVRVCTRATYFKEVQTKDGVMYQPCSPSDPEGIEMRMHQIPNGKLTVHPL